MVFDFDVKLGENHRNGTTVRNNGSGTPQSFGQLMPSDQEQERRPILGRGGPNMERPVNPPNLNEDMMGFLKSSPVPSVYSKVPQPSVGQRPRNQLLSRMPPGVTYCAFCIQNQETVACWSSHKIKDRKTGVVTCPVLRCHVCQLCGATGDSAHTEAYCRRQPIGRSVATALKMTPRNSTGLRDRNRY